MNATNAVSDNSSPEDSVIVRLQAVRKLYGDMVAVESLDLDIRRGEFFTLLGPSGSGKTTTLRMIAGFERPSGGHVELDGVDITDVPPFNRDINTVFQDYALFPHMSVAKNLAYGLEAKRLPRKDINQRVDDALRMVHLEDHAGHLPGQLSGGQQQRIALARAVVNQPRVLLLDEPLGALDLKLRQHMQVELKRIQQEIDTTFIYVTHDQEEALVMSDRIAVFNKGRIEQMGEAVELYERPASEFVANFLGTSNLIDLDGKRVMIRPEKIRLLVGTEARPADSWHEQAATVQQKVFLGPSIRYLVRLECGTELLALEQNVTGFSNASAIMRGSRVRVAWSRDSVYEIPDTNR
ncbi:ABC transporter ATP-binding protein [Marinobacter antarcticus]|uniref:ABC transporter ATP-binding protein n=2 Tax=root TaxID=1 RepID=A0A831VW28_9GAMM|nr:ABC transporter ATP-binding protein [Marinobacter antarcticus]HEA53683.1 ABC transporter ATP-binding protein [Marinobacter antarcticus]